MRNRKLLLLVALLGMALVACTKAPSTVSPITSPALSQNSPPSTPEPPPENMAKGRLIFRSDRDGALNWYTMKADGTDIQELTFLNNLSISELRWIPELQQFAILTALDHQEDFYLMDVRGNIGARLTVDPGGKGEIDYSDVAKKFVYTCTFQDLDICIVPMTGGASLNVFKASSRDIFPTWSPDGKTILLLSNRSGVPDIWTVQADGENAKNMSLTGQPHASPSWSPDGSKILFTSLRDTNWEVYTMDADGNNPKNLTDDEGRDVVPGWSPDGSHIAFRSDRTGDDDIYIMAADGSGLLNVTQTPGVNETVFLWSPDSGSILYVSRVTGDIEIFSVKLDGTDKRNLTNNPAQDIFSQWIQ